MAVKSYLEQIEEIEREQAAQRRDYFAEIDAIEAERSQPKRPGPTAGQIATDLALDVGPSTLGQGAGVLLAPFTGGLSIPVLGAVGGGVGNVGKQFVQMAQGRRDKFSWGEFGADVAISSIPGVKNTKAGVSAARRAMQLGKQAAAMGVGGQVIEKVIDEGRLPTLGEAIPAALGGFTLGAGGGLALGALEKKLAKHTADSKSLGEFLFGLRKAAEEAKDETEYAQIKTVEDWYREQLIPPRTAQDSAEVFMRELPAPGKSAQESAQVFTLAEAERANRQRQFDLARAEEAMQGVQARQLAGDESIIMAGDPLTERLAKVETRPGTSARERDRISQALQAQQPQLPPQSGAQLSPQAQRMADEYGRVNPQALSTLGGGAAGAVYGSTQGETLEERAENALLYGGLGAAGGYGLGRAATRAGAKQAPGTPSPRSPAETAVRPGPGNPPGSKSKELGLIESAKASPELDPRLREGLSAFYEPRSNQQTLAEATRRIDAAGSIDAAKTSLFLKEAPDAADQAMGLELVRSFQAENRFGDAADILYHMAEKAKTQGQAIQILSTLARSTPEGMARYVQRTLGRKLTPEELAKINAGMKRVDAAKSPEVKLTRQAQLLDEIARKQGGKWDEKATAMLNMSMLLNPKTTIRNIGGNQIMATADLGADVLTPAIDWGVSIFTGKRTVSGPQMMEYFKGLAQPARDFRLGYQEARAGGASRITSMKEGVDTIETMARMIGADKLEIGDIRKMYRSVFSSPLMRNLDKTMTILMGAPDRAFYTARFRSSIKSQMDAAGVNSPTAEMIDRASLEAARTVYRDQNFVSDALREVRGTLNFASTLGKSRRFGAGQAIIPFVQVPGALLVRGLEYSPAGFLKVLSESVGPLLDSSRQFNQREFSQAFSKALIGSGGLVGTGYALGKLNIVSGGAEEDPRARAVQKSLGFGEYRINVSALKRAFQSMDWKTPQEWQEGDLIVNYDWAQPLSFPVAMGADYARTERQIERDRMTGKKVQTPGRVLSALGSGLRTLEEQPLLTGLSGFASEVAWAQQAGGGMLEGLGRAMLQFPQQFTPTAARQVRDLLDNRVYETRGSDHLETAYNQVLANLPAMAEASGLKPRADVLGDLQERYQANGNTFFNVLVNPAFTTRFRTDPELREIYRLWQQTGETSHIPGRQNTITINGNPKVLTAQERADYQQFVGRLTRDAFKMAMRSDAYANAPDEMKAKRMAEFVSAANTAAKVLLFGHRPRTLDKYDRALLGLAGQNETTRGMIATPPGR